MTSPAETIIQGSEIPSVPHVLRKILVLADDPDSSSRDLERLVMQEPGLVTHLLKTVNSAYYATNREITSVNRAIVMLGFLAVKSIASGLALIDAFNNIPGLNKDYVLTVWRQSLTCAGLIKILSRGMPRNRQDDLFLTAMVHNAGHLVLAQYFQSDYDVLIQDEPFPSPEQERGHFQTDHAEAGALLLDKWKFPERIVELVRFHHNPENYPGNPVLLKYLEICNIISEKHRNLDEFLKQPEENVDPSFMDSLNEIDLSWKGLKDKQELLVESANLARQIIPGSNS